MSNTSKIITRFAPSPTGLLHLGNYRTALFNYLYAKKMGGQFLLRVEDTDRERSKPEFEQNILDSLAWLGLEYDRISKQSENVDKHTDYLQKLIASGRAYHSKEEVKEAGQRAEVIRFKNPNRAVTFIDLIRGEVSFDTTDLGDFVIAKSETEPLFHLAVVVDDFESSITHIIRGEDHISNTPRHILLQEAIGAPTPIYAHLPLVLAPDRSKLSKRHGALPITDYRDAGFLPEAIINFMALLGWSPQHGEGTNEEIFNLTELIERFDLSAVGKSGAIFNIEKLAWLNKTYLAKLTLEEKLTYVTKVLPSLDQTVLTKITPLILDRASNFEDIKKMKEAGELAYFFESPKPNKDLLKNTAHLVKVSELLGALPQADWTIESIKNSVWDFATEVGRAEVLWPMRVALSGQAKSADPFTIAAIIGQEETLARLTYAQNL
ncbi:MAG: glutamate--tRNA ligase [Candidatus Vogelbacteria bacterium]|nr:glutamate--tRNA ligase [Candidatus Vogelbacteria bacterium]